MFVGKMVRLLDLLMTKIFVTDVFMNVNHPHQLFCAPQTTSAEAFRVSRFPYSLPRYLF